MKKLSILLFFPVIMLLCGCTRQVVFLDRDLATTKSDFDKYISTTGYSYKLKDDTNNIYNVCITNYNYQMLLQSKPIVSYDIGFTCKFKPLNNDTYMYCKTYPSNLSPLTDVRKHLKEAKLDDIKYMSYKKYKKQKGNL